MRFGTCISDAVVGDGGAMLLNDLDNVLNVIKP
jgi:hypothetical protein